MAPGVPFLPAFSIVFRRGLGRSAAVQPDSAAAAPPAVEAAGLSRRFGSVVALDRVSLSVRQGEFFSLLGPSGCGKTTLLRLIAGLDLPDAGTLSIAGADTAGVPAHQRHVNTVFQSYALFPHMTARDNVGFGLRVRRVPAAQLNERVARAMEITQISDLSGRMPAQLSGGQKQRVALARAIVNEPAVLLLDEPLGALDLKLRQQLQGELHALQRRLGITFIYVTHDQQEALVMSDRIAVMNAGRIEQLAAPAVLYERPRTRFVAQFLGSCNLLEATATSLTAPMLQADTPLGRLQVRLRGDESALSPGARRTLAIRPEKLQLLKALPETIPNTISATIAELVYSGAETTYRLMCGDLKLSVTALNARLGHQGLHVGETVFCHLPAEALIVLDE
jgi:spermidine/putrescine transport system ATP-binding protein